MPLRLPRTLRALLGGAFIAFAFAPTAAAETGAPVAVAVDVQAAGVSVAAAVTAAPPVDVSSPTEPAAPTAAVPVEASASASAPVASAAASTGAPAPAPRAEAQATVGREPAVSARVDPAGAPTVAARVDAGPAPRVRVAVPPPARSEEPAAPRAATPVAEAPRGLERAAGTSSAGPYALAQRMRPESSLPSPPDVSAITAVADLPPASPPVAERETTAPVSNASDSAGRRRVSERAPAPFSHFPGPLAPPGGSAAGAAAAWVVLLFALAAWIFLAPPTLRRRLRLRRIPIRSCSYRLLLERPG